MTRHQGSGTTYQPVNQQANPMIKIRSVALGPEGHVGIRDWK